MSIDLRSDTVTHPTEEMREAARSVQVGDDVFGEDPSVNELEQYAAELLGMQDALFVSSGTQGNLISILSHTVPGGEILLEKESHIYYYEVGGLSAIGGTIPWLYSSDRGYATREQILESIRPANIHFPDPQLLCIENTHNRHGGVALAPSEVEEMTSAAKENGLKVHMDGARFFNAVVAHNASPHDYTKHLDSVQVCLSKGLSAPIGSIVAGSESFIARARKKRKMLGGGMRQVGIIAAPGLIALRDMRDRLRTDHDNAQKLANGLKGLGINVWEPQTNIVVCDVSDLFSNAVVAKTKLEDRGVKTITFSDKLIRMTTHRHITSNDIEKALEIIKEEWIESTE